MADNVEMTDRSIQGGFSAVSPAPRNKSQEETKRGMEREERSIKGRYLEIKEEVKVKAATI